MDNPTAISATRRSYKELADGTLRVQFDIDPQFKPSFLDMFPEIDMPAAIAPLEPSASLVPHGTSEDNPAYGRYAKSLRLSNFFRQPEVLSALGDDAAYRRWIQQQKCVVCGQQDYVEETGEMRCEAAHVRRADSFGVAYKAKYACISLCHKHHHQQHNEGEEAIGGSLFINRECDRQRDEWAWWAMKQHLGVTSMKQASPTQIREWATHWGIQEFLP